MRNPIDIRLSGDAQKYLASGQLKLDFRNATPDEPAEIAVYGTVGDPWEGNDARSVMSFLRENRGRPVNVLINSPGGLAYDGIAIYNDLIGHDAPVTTVITGMAGSAASVIAMAGQRVLIHETAQLFIHRALAVAVGNVSVMNEMATWLSKIDDAIAKTYQVKTGKRYETIMGLMTGKVDGTVFSAQEAVDGKFADEIIRAKDQKKQQTASATSWADDVRNSLVDSARREFLNATEAMLRRARAARGIE